MSFSSVATSVSVHKCAVRLSVMREAGASDLMYPAVQQCLSSPIKINLPNNRKSHPHINTSTPVKHPRSH